MKTFIYVLLSLVFFSSCQSGKKVENAQLFSKNNLVAWCIVPFDTLNRSPEERAAMLDSLGIKQLAYDWRTKHVPSFPDEMATLKAHNIGLKSVWMWIEPDSAELLGPDNQKILEIIKQNNVKTDLWLGFSNKYFDNLSDEKKLEKAVAAVQAIHKIASDANCTISLYNHGDWFGEPSNQIRIIEQSGLNDVGMVYNFHHGHQQVSEFPSLLPKMLPYLRTVNINGMKAGGPQILPIGQGDQEKGMLEVLKQSGFQGSIGILGHVDADIKVILEGNLKGLQSLLKEMGDESALASYK